MKSIQPHTHEQRTEIVEQLIPLFHTKFGDNLLAVAANASYARGTDIRCAISGITTGIRIMAVACSSQSRSCGPSSGPMVSRTRRW